MTSAPPPATIADRADASSRARVLDAGCGRHRAYRQFADAEIVGMDVDEAALAANTDITEKIVGDIRTYRFEPESYDAIICCDVLEHLPDPQHAIANLARALKPGGRMILRTPNPVTPKSIVAKWTPLWFHLWFYRSVYKNELVGRPGFGPYKTYLRWSLRPGAVARLARRCGLELAELELYESRRIRELANRHPVLTWIVTSLWPGDPFLTEMEVVFTKREPVGS